MRFLLAPLFSIFMLSGSGGRSAVATNSSQSVIAYQRVALIDTDMPQGNRGEA